jgi:hypothetical protein
MSIHLVLKLFFTGMDSYFFDSDVEGTHLTMFVYVSGFAVKGFDKPYFKCLYGVQCPLP